MTASASDVTLFGSTLSDEASASASARVSWPGDLSSLEGLEKTEVDFGLRPPRAETRDSDMSDEFFGFAGSSSKVKKEEEEETASSVEDPLAGGFSASASKAKSSKAKEWLSDESDMLSFPGDRHAKPPVAVANGKVSSGDDDLFSNAKTTIATKRKGSETLGGKDIFASESSAEKVEQTSKETINKAVKEQITSPLDNEELFSSPLKDDIMGNNPTKIATHPLEAKNKDTSETDVSSSLVANGAKTDKMEIKKTANKSNEFSPPLGEDDDLFIVSKPQPKKDDDGKKTLTSSSSKTTTAKATSAIDVSTFDRVYCV